MILPHPLSKLFLEMALKRRKKHEKENHRNSSFDAGGHYGGVCDKYQR